MLPYSGATGYIRKKSKQSKPKGGGVMTPSKYVNVMKLVYKKVVLYFVALFCRKVPYFGFNAVIGVLFL